jgi:hypothetical protein
MTFETILEQMAAMHRAENKYRSSTNLAAALSDITVQETILSRIGKTLARIQAQGQFSQVEGERKAIADATLKLAVASVRVILALESIGGTK